MKIHYQLPGRGITACGHYCADWQPERLTGEATEVTCLRCAACHLMPGGGGQR